MIVRSYTGYYMVTVLIGLLFSIFCVSAEPLRVVSYNVENLFYPERDSLNSDTSFTPGGEHRWSYTRYYRKVENIAKVLTNIGEWDGVDIVGLQEVESAACLRRLCYTLRRGEYDFVHYDSPDQRGIDVALVYRKARFDTIRTKVFPVDLGEQTTRDILYVCGRTAHDTLHFLVCHLPSQLSGTAESEWKRVAAKQVLQRAVDSVLSVQPNARIIVMGDMNSQPKDDLSGLKNRMLTFLKEGKGTHKYQGQWTCLDQFYTTNNLLNTSSVRIYDADFIQEVDEKYLDLKPKRCFIGYRYQNGYSDHLPVVLVLGN